MLKKLIVCSVLAGVVGFSASNVASGALLADITLSGTAKTCLNTSIAPVEGVRVSFFRVSNVRPLLAHLDSMDKFTQGRQENDTTMFAQFDAMETVMQNMISTTPAILRRTSAADGTFAITISPVDSILVTGYANMEDEPYVYDYKVFPGNTSRSFILDMTRGQCGF
jgi:hypothetical protein